MNKKLFAAVPAQLLDNQIENIEDLSKKFEVTLAILMFENVSASVLEIKSHIKPGVYEFHEIKYKIRNHEVLEQYFCYLDKVLFIVYGKPAFFYNLFLNLKLILSALLIKPHLVFIDDFSGVMLPFVFIMLAKRNLALGVHDPIPHTGETRFFDHISNFIRSRCFAIITYSEFARSQFIAHNGRLSNVFATSLRPYKFYKKIYELSTFNCKTTKNNQNEINFLFFGRFSPYKGISELVTAFTRVADEYENAKLILAGNGPLDFDMPAQYVDSKKIILYNRFILPCEVGQILTNANFLICPYRDATQSGVLMTAKPFGINVIASNVGSFPEYIGDFGASSFCFDINDPDGLYKALVYALAHYKSEIEMSERNSAAKISLDEILSSLT